MFSIFLNFWNFCFVIIVIIIIRWPEESTDLKNFEKKILKNLKKFKKIEKYNYIFEKFSYI